MLSKKSPRGSCGIGKRNNRIGRTGSLNQRCALAPDLESILRGRTRKILFRQHRSLREELDLSTCGPLYPSDRKWLSLSLTSRSGHEPTWTCRAVLGRSNSVPYPREQKCRRAQSLLVRAKTCREQS